MGRRGECVDVQPSVVKERYPGAHRAAGFTQLQSRREKVQPRREHGASELRREQPGWARGGDSASAVRPAQPCLHWITVHIPRQYQVHSSVQIAGYDSACNAPSAHGLLVRKPRAAIQYSESTSAYMSEGGRALTMSSVWEILSL